MEITSENAEEMLKEKLREYAEYRKSKEWQEKEGYKWEFVKNHKGVFNDLNDLQKKIDSLGSQNFFPYVWKTSIFRFFSQDHEREFKEALSILFDEKILLEKRIAEFIDKLNPILLEDRNWKSKNFKVDVDSASFFLFLNKPKEYFLYPVVEPFKRFAKFFYLKKYNEELFDTEKKIIRYLAWQSYCKEKLIPLLREVLDSEPDLLDAEDAMYCIAIHLTKNVELSKEQSSKIHIPKISKEEHEERLKVLRDAGLLK